MRGVITGHDIAQHAALIRQEFGTRCLLRCVWGVISGRPTTFLELAWDCVEEPEPAPPRDERDPRT